MNIADLKEPNAQGEYSLWDKGQLIGWTKVEDIDGCMVVPKMAPLIRQMKADAAKDGVKLTIGAGYRPVSKQIELRKRYLIDRSKLNDQKFILEAPSSAFKPVCAKPGFSNHSDGTAVDFNVTGKPDSYKWLVKNAIKYGFIRTVLTEIWHWELRPGKMFDFVPKNHPTWDNLV